MKMETLGAVRRVFFLFVSNVENLKTCDFPGELKKVVH